MGAIWYRRIEFAATISELAGYKSGLALTKQQITEHVPEFDRWFDGDDDHQIRIRAEEVGELFGNLLFALGSAHTPGITIPGLSLTHKYKSDPDKIDLCANVVQMFGTWVRSQTTRYDLGQFVQLAAQKLGSEAGTIAAELARETMESVHKGPWNVYRKVEWKDQAELTNLFDSEKLGSSHGRFFDQRFIDYLHRNFESVDQINWRQFEGFAAEFFVRAGFRVEVGPGRNDNSVDLRVWRSDDPLEAPPALIVQCKRQKDRVGKIVVKALWADVAHERAESGLIVTTSAFSPGARKVCTARAYPVIEANRETVRRWIKAMRTPGTGVFMGE